MFKGFFAFAARLFQKLDLVEYVLVIKDDDDIEVFDPATLAIATNADALDIIVDWYWNWHEHELPQGRYKLVYDPNICQVASCEPLTNNAAHS